LSGQRERAVIAQSQSQFFVIFLWDPDGIAPRRSPGFQTVPVHRVTAKNHLLLGLSKQSRNHVPHVRILPRGRDYTFASHLAMRGVPLKASRNCSVIPRWT
jgi:hypothetical protein